MDKHSNTTSNISAQPHLHQHAAVIQPQLLFGLMDGLQQIFQ